MSNRKFKPQKKNPNLHNARGIKLLEESITELGYVAPLTTAADGEVIDGSARLQAIKKVMPEAEPIIVEHDGSRPIIMVRTDIPDGQTEKARQISYAANRIGQIDLAFAPDILLEDINNGLDLSSLFTSAEIAEITNLKTDLPEIPDAGENTIRDEKESVSYFTIECPEELIERFIDILNELKPSGLKWNRRE